MLKKKKVNRSTVEIRKIGEVCRNTKRSVFRQRGPAFLPAFRKKKNVGLPWGGPGEAGGSPLDGAQWRVKYCC